ncbi:MAG: IclR family transcriptional regulator [Actinomycetota bacterium]
MGSSRNRLSSVANAARVLKSFSAERPTWGVSELAAELSLSTSTVHRLLSTLADEGVLDQDEGSGRYRLGLSVFDLAAAMTPQRSLHEAVLVSMTELRSRTGETVQVGVLDERQVVYVERLDSPNTSQLFTRLGRRNHAHCTSSGKVLLAHLPRLERERLLDDWELPAMTGQTITDPEALRRELSAVRRQGYAENREESEPGIVSVAAPIHDDRRRVVASLSIAGPSERMDPNRRAYAHAVMALAVTVSRQMGWEPDGSAGSRSASLSVSASVIPQRGKTDDRTTTAS